MRDDPHCIPEEKLVGMIVAEELAMGFTELRLWDTLKIPPARWRSSTYLGGSYEFWVVGVIGNVVVWYDQFEDEWGVSHWTVFGDFEGSGRYAPGSLRRTLGHIALQLSERPIGPRD